ncbi:MAG TPA: DEAD/DEAH box helicase [Polyangiales bacterium]|nr:DEAD/DEAH box helicase [Polyangiales bacterium]
MRADVGGGEREDWLQQLTGLARGLFGELPPELIARHLLAMIPEPDAQLRRAAMQALARRFKFAQRDQLAVTERPKHGVLGTYRTAAAPARKKQAGPRPYETVVLSLSPLATSCSCADFVRSALGLCKHGLTVLNEIDLAQLGQLAPAPLRWAPQGELDRLARLSASIALPGFVPSADHYRPDARALDDRVAFIHALEASPVEREPAVRTLLAEERERAERGAFNRARMSEALASLPQLARDLYPYQREGVERFFACGRLLLADDIGLGKTTQAVACCHGLFASGRIERGLLIVPLALKAQWKREWDAITSAPLTVVEGTPKERYRAYDARKPGFLLLGYEQLVRDLDGVQRFDPQLVVLDEAQRIKNWATKSAAYVKALSPNYRLVLTGTPLENKLDELASIMDFVDDVALEPKWRLTPAFGVEGERGLKGMRNLDQLRARLAPHMLRRVRRDVLTQLPPRVDTVVPVPLSEPQQEAHDELKRPIAQLAQRRARRGLSGGEFMQLMKLLTRQRMICNGMAQLQFEEQWPRIEHEAPTPALLEGLFAPKLVALRGLIEQIVLGQGRKVVVFSQWRGMLRLAEWAVRDVLGEQRAVFFTGAESAAQRDRAVQELHDDPQVAVMFLSDAGGVGLNLQRAASCCINLELPWNPAVLEQRIGRIHRLGQGLPIDVYNLVCEDGLEGRIAQLLASKGALFDAVFDGTSDAVSFERSGSLLDGLELDTAHAGSDDDEPEVEEEAAPEAPPPAFDLAAALAERGLELTSLPDGCLRVVARPDATEALLAALRAILPSRA